MIDLEKISGLPIKLNEKTAKLKFGAPLADVQPSVRKFSELKEVLMDPESKPTRDADEVYFMYRDVHKPEDEKVIRENHVRYDLTVIPPAMYGKEFIKTVGHYHSMVPGEDYAYPEIYEVLHGEAMFMIQKQDKDNPDQIRTVMVIKAVAGDKVIYPPNYGHIIVNIGKEVLVTANWVSDQYTADYKAISDKKGMAYYVVAGYDRPYEIVPNKNYQNLPEIRFATGHMNSLGFLSDEPMYVTGMRHPGRLEFLNKPRKYAVELSTITS